MLALDDAKTIAAFPYRAVVSSWQYTLNMMCGASKQTAAEPRKHYNPRDPSARFVMLFLF
jgi:hypothetical protein